MSNYQYDLLNLFGFLFHLGVFQYVRDILQFTVSLDHPVDSFSLVNKQVERKHAKFYISSNLMGVFQSFRHCFTFLCVFPTKILAIQKNLLLERLSFGSFESYT